MKWVRYKDGSVKIRLTAAEVPCFEHAVDEGFSGFSYLDDDEAKDNLDLRTYRSWKHMGRPCWLGMINRFHLEER